MTDETLYAAVQLNIYSSETNLSKREEEKNSTLVSPYLSFFSFSAN